MTRMNPTTTKEVVSNIEAEEDGVIIAIITDLDVRFVGDIGMLQTNAISGLMPITLHPNLTTITQETTHQVPI